MSERNLMIALRSCCVIFLSLLAGCGGGTDVEVLDVVPALGSVKVNGEPAAGVSVSFSPSGTTKGSGGYATTDSSGQFAVKYKDGRDGVPPGEYIVLFTQVLKPDGTPLGPNEMAADAGAQNVLPPIYGSMEDNPNRVVVSESDFTFDFDLQARKR